MKNLINYIRKHTDRGECQCGLCIDKEPDRAEPNHSSDVHFFWVSKIGNPKREKLEKLLIEEYPDLEGLKGGPSYIDLGYHLGDQELALLLIGLGELVGTWGAITPKVLGIEDDKADEFAGMGYVMCSGLRS